MENGTDGRTILRIVLIVEGRTEKAFLPHFETFSDLACQPQCLGSRLFRVMGAFLRKSSFCRVVGISELAHEQRIMS